MIKKVFAAMAVVAAMFAGYSTSHAQNGRELNKFALTNVEALVKGENPDRFLIVDKKSVEIWDEETQTNKKMITIFCEGIGSEKCE